MERPFEIPVHPGVVPFEQEVLDLGLAQQRQAGERRLRASHGRGQQPLVMTRQPHRGRRVEEIAVVDHVADQPLGRLHQGQVEIELVRAGAGGQGQGVEAGQGHAVHGGVLQDEQDLEQRRMGQGALGLQLLDQLFEGEVLAGVRGEDRLPGAREQILERRIARQVRTQYQGIHKEADEPFGLGPVAAGDGGSHGHVVPVGEPAEQGLESDEQHHEGGRSLPPGEGLDPLPERRGEGNGEAPSTAALDRRTRAVGGQVQHGGRSGQMAPPETELPLQHLSPQPLPLPDGEVGVLDG
jgi:hypothetical protein